MLIPTFFTILALFSLFTATSGLPSIKPHHSSVIIERSLAGPKSLLGRYYLRGHTATASLKKPVPIDVDFAQYGPTGRADRFYAVQHKRARRSISEGFDARAQRNEEFLSHETPIAPVMTTTNQPPTQTIVLTQVQAPLPTPNTSITLIPRPTGTPHVNKHHKGDGRKKVVSKKSTAESPYHSTR